MNQVINDFRPEINALLKRFTDAGFSLVSADNGEDKLNFDGDLKKFVACLDACDESRLHVSRGNQKTWLFLVLGNSPGEIVSDYGVRVGDEVTEFNTAVDDITSAHYTEWSEKPQPKTTMAERYGKATA